jgi:type IV pilus assembly protein PilA
MQPGPPSPYYPAPPPRKSDSRIIIVAVIVIGVVLLVIPVLASIAIYGVRRYISAAKTSEAKNTVGAIARAARASYERERAGGDGATHSLCNTAVAVPATIPAGRKYQPATGGADFDTGDEATGWKCLRFAMTTPMYYKYSYTKGGGPVTSGKPNAPKVGGAESFEAAAEGDLDGDASTSTFAIVGQEGAPGEMRVATQIYVLDEFE